MAYSLDRSIYAGFGVTLPILLWDALRIAVPIWLGVRIIPDMRWAWLAAAAIAVLMESTLSSVFPWRLGYLQSQYLWTYQAADIFGPSWSTLTAFAHAGLNQILFVTLFGWFKVPRQADTGGFSVRKDASFYRIMPVMSVCTLNLAYSVFALAHWQARLSSDANEIIRVGLLQVDPSFVESRDTAQQRTDAMLGKVDLVFWPESSAGTYATDLYDLSTIESIFQKSQDPERGKLLWPNSFCPLIAGGKTYVGDRENPVATYVSAMLVNEHQQLTDRYHKRYLMPFGEFIPGASLFPQWKELFEMADSIAQGKVGNVLKPNASIRVGAMLCYEDMMPAAAESFIDNEANLLACLIDGSSFDSATTLRQHRKLAQFRAVEHRRYLLRCAATGETCVIAPTGQVVARLPPQQDGTLVTDVSLIEDRTVYSRTRGVFPLIMLFTLGLLDQLGRRRKLS